MSNSASVVSKSNLDHKVQTGDKDAHSKIRSLHPRRLQTVENFIVIWLDSNIDESGKGTQNVIDHLRGIVNLVKTFTDAEQCIAYLNDVQDEKVFMIVSSFVSQQFVPLVVDKSQLASIYVLCDDRDTHQQWTSSFEKIKGVFVKIEDLCNRLKLDVRQCDNDLTPTSIMSSSSTTSLDALNLSFMYSQLLKEILLEDISASQKKQEFFNFCRHYYGENKRELKMIDEIEEKYPNPSLIWWYTRDCFLYPMLNKALRTQEIEMIMKMGFIVRDLHRNIERLHAEQNRQEPFIVYRGLKMLASEIDKLTKSKGGLLAFESFLSTSTEKYIALGFAGEFQSNSDLIPVIFQIKIDPKISTTPFASVDKVSYFHDDEKEILFSIHTVFRIGEIKEIDRHKFQVSLTLPTDNDPQITRLTQCMRQVIQGPTGIHRMGQLMCHMGEFDKAERIYTTLVNTLSDDERQQLALVHHQLGYINKQKGDLASALSHYQQSLDIKLNYLSANDPQLSPTYCNIAGILQDQGDLESALDHLKFALKIDLRAPKPDPLSIAIRHNNIGSVLEDQGNYDEALTSYEQALEIQLAHLPARHPSIATTYNNIGLLHRNMGDNSSALSFYRKTLDIFEKTLTTHHPSLAVSHNNIAMVLDDLHRTTEAIVHAERALDITRQTFGFDHPNAQRRQAYLDALRQTKN